MMDQQINIDSAPARIEVNYDELAAALDEELAQYSNLVVTPENIADAKRQATAVNKLAGDLDAKRKDAVREVSEPIRAFEQQIKTLVAKCQETRQGILDQVDKYEARVREQARRLLGEYREALWDNEHGVDPEFQRADIEDLCRIGSVTQSGKLTKAAREAVEARVQRDLSRQRQIRARLANLEAASYKAGLYTPLRLAHVESFLFVDDDEEYTRRLEALIETEVERQQASEAAARQKFETEEAERRARSKCDGNHAAPACDDPECWIDGEPQNTSQQKPTPEPPVAGEGASDAQDPAPATEGAPADYITQWTVNATFAVVTPPGVTADQVKDKVRSRLTSAGIQDPDYLEAIANA